MKVIQSLGGPYIVLPRAQLANWGGIDRQGFTAASSPQPNDYEAAGILVDGKSHPPCNAAVLRGADIDALVITMPLSTALMPFPGPDVYIVQVHAAEPHWTFEAVKMQHFDKARHVDIIHFTAIEGEYVVFDSVHCEDDIEDNILTFNLNAGSYQVISGYSEDDLSILGVLRIQRTPSGHLA